MDRNELFAAFDAAKNAKQFGQVVAIGELILNGEGELGFVADTLVSCWTAYAYSRCILTGSAEASSIPRTLEVVERGKQVLQTWDVSTEQAAHLAETCYMLLNQALLVAREKGPAAARAEVAAEMASLARSAVDAIPGSDDLKHNAIQGMLDEVGLRAGASGVSEEMAVEFLGGLGISLERKSGETYSIYVNLKKAYWPKPGKTEIAYIGRDGAEIALNVCTMPYFFGPDWRNAPQGMVMSDCWFDAVAYVVKSLYPRMQGGVLLVEGSQG